MYIQITTRCNMTCEHCFYRCTAQGVDMSHAVYQAAVALAAETGDTISIGGGEPTIHPLFWQFLGEALGSGCEYVWLATNGKVTNTALALAGLSKGSELLGVALSQDDFHDTIEQRVVDAFRRSGLELRDTSNHLSNAGRAADNDLGGDDHCVCGGVMVKPNGDIYPCGCADAPKVGNVLKGGISKRYQKIMDKDEYRDCECWNGYKRSIAHN